ncbi:MAG: type II toxin-antitoxin system RelE/ParE family toxin [Lysobacterales bacterium]|nr:MAG: type II toxin-antitoxin system RelE/ParE family toxin [Xanthomonadales bacterium]
MKIQATLRFTKWLDSLDDVRGRARIQARIQRLADGHAGRCRSLKWGVSELKVDVGPGYRVYYTQQRHALAILLCGGDKSSQTKDIELAYRLVKDLTD